MKGMVRLLLFWVGKEDVGGGRISILEPSENGGFNKIDGIEVLFGAVPDRIPGGHNRWGYARELAFWEQPSASGAPILTRVLFEGFMSKADEGSLTQVQESSASGDTGTLYEGTVSTVEDLQAKARLWRFYSSGNDTFRSPQHVGNTYAARVKSEQADIDRVLDNGHKVYSEPFGFITAVRSFVLEALAAKEANSSLSVVKDRKQGYAHNALLYALSVKRVKLHKTFELSTGEKFREVLEFDMETTNRKSGGTHSFSLHVATKNGLRGIPLRIVDRPRWWLKLQLELDIKGTEHSVAG